MDRGLVHNTNELKEIECFVDTDFAGGWNYDDLLNPENVLSRTGFVIMRTSMPVFLRVKLQTEIASSTCEKHIALSTSMREVIQVTQLSEGLKVACDAIATPPIATCQMFEDDQSYILVAESKNPPTFTKQISIKHHHFRGLVGNVIVKIT